jgi:hypothetical protein
MRQIFTSVPAINSEANTSLGSSSNFTIRFAETCCFVFSKFTSFLFRENKATSAPEMMNISSNKIISVIAKKVVPFGLTARKIPEK